MTGQIRYASAYYPYSLNADGEVEKLDNSRRQALHWMSIRRAMVKLVVIHSHLTLAAVDTG